MATADEVLGFIEGQQQPQQPPQPMPSRRDRSSSSGSAKTDTYPPRTSARRCRPTKKIDYALGPKILKKDFNSSELRIWICQMRYFWNAQAMDNRDEDTQWGNFWHCLDHSLCSLYKPKILRGVGVSIFED
jgi:hypothetical protein